MTTAQATSSFEQRFGTNPEVIIRSPGRVNLMGDHTDYNDGLVLPIAIDRSTIVSIGRTDSQCAEIYSVAFDDTANISISEPSSDKERPWSRYIAGVLSMLRRHHVPLTGLRIWIGGDLPPGAGLASSASLEVGVARGLLELAGKKMSPVALATMCRAAEQEFAGAPCGLMDQLCCTSSQPDHALFFDCRAMRTQHVPLVLDQASLVVIDSGVRHEIAGCEYANRRRECAIALDALRDAGLANRSLRDVSLKDLQSTLREIDELSARRVRHVVTENARVEEAVAALQSNDMTALGWLMNDSHESLRDDYEVSCKEIDALVKLTSEIEGVLGARMTGGGFGGCVIAVAQRDAVDRIADTIQQQYNEPLECAASVFKVRSVGRVSVEDQLKV